MRDMVYYPHAGHEKNQQDFLTVEIFLNYTFYTETKAFVFSVLVHCFFINITVQLFYEARHLF